MKTYQERFQDLIEKYHIYDAYPDFLAIEKNNQKSQYSSETISEEYWNKQSYIEINANIEFWKKSTQEEKKSDYLRKIIANCVMIKDFLSCKKYIRIFQESRYEGYENYKIFWDCVDRLLIEMIEECSKRKQKDIIINWIDALRYDELNQMSFLKKEAKSSVFFENAFTVLPNTSHTLRTLLRGGLPIDDYQFEELISNKNNSWLLAYLEKKGYVVRYYGDSNSKYLDYKYVFEYTKKNSGISSMNFWWKMLNEVLQSNKPVFAIVHCLWETHQPYMCPEMDCDKEQKYLNSKTAENFLKIEKARTYFDKQLEYMHSFYLPNAIQIYMSDHGKLDDSFRDAVCHTVFFVKGKGLKKKSISELFSYNRFGILIENIIEKKENILEGVLTEYVQLQTYATYEKKHILYELKHNVISLGFRAIRSKYDKYIRNYDGSEIYYRLPDENYNQIDNVKYKERIELLKKENGDLFIDYQKYPFFKEAYKEQLFLESIKEREERRIDKNCEIIKKEFQNIEPDKRVAFRGGGRHTIELLKLFERKNQIICLCDNNKKNVSSEMTFPICEVNELKKMDIDIVIISSFKNRSLFINEIKENYPEMEILDIYDILEKNDSKLSKAFYEYNFTEEDYMKFFD